MLIKFVNNRLGYDYQLKTPLYIVVMNTVVMLAVIIGLIIFVFRMKSFLVDPHIWFSISMLSYGICLSGIVYSISIPNAFF
jgi:hypothetical protein